MKNETADQLHGRAEILNGFQSVAEGENFLPQMMGEFGSEAGAAIVAKLSYAIARAAHNDHTDNKNRQSGPSAQTRLRVTDDRK